MLIRYTHAATVPMMTTREIEISPLLQSCFLRTETDCVRECCGTDAFNPDPDVVRQWAREAGDTSAGQALVELRTILTACEDRSFVASSSFLNACTPTEESREELIAFLRQYEAALQASV